VAKEAAGIILLDDNFKSIVTAIKYGRNIFECIRKFIQFQLTVNFVAISMAFIGGAVLRESPLNAIQMLWVNLIMDTLASLSLATEPPAEDLLHRKPYSRFESLITPVMWKNIILHAIFQVIILNFLLFKGPETFGIPSSINVPVWNNETGKHYAMFFHTFVLLQLFNELNARKLKNEEVNVFADFFNNPLYVLIGVLEFGGQVLIVQYGGKAVKCVPLSTTEHLLCFLMGSLSLYVGFFIKTMFPANFIISPKEFTCGPIHYQWGSYEDHFEEPESKKED
jgi:P-type Ca2+ transporter type 2B